MKNNFVYQKFGKKLKLVKNHIKQLQDRTDEQLADMTDWFKERLTKGETLDDILPEAYAVVCEADRRILGKAPYDVQILGAIAMHNGYLTEMNTGEGKTLVATMPLYLNALKGKSAILVTTNEYLVLRDAKEMGQVYNFLKLSIKAGVSEDSEKQFTNQEKKEIYAADIVYTTHSVLGFDYLLNNLVTDAKDRFMREFNFIIIDEADSVLLDSAQTPLVISGSPRVMSNLYEQADFFVTTLIENEDYEKEDKKVWLTPKGIKYAEDFFSIKNFYAEENFEINRHVTLALRAHALFEIEKEYMVSSEGEIRLLDGGSGRLMPGVKLRGGQHQALEVKEKCTITKENRSVASITYQNLFLLFPKMAGMSGTISDATRELMEVYNEKVCVIPPRCPVIRKDERDRFYKSADEQFEAAIKDACNTYERQQPVLIVTSTIAETELVSRILVSKHIPHNLLNANNSFWEADIIKEAGKRGAVTVATSMAGRGTDIKLGEGVKELGGLKVIGVGRMFNTRQERQARGRAGRQGDPGQSAFYVCLEDEVVLENSPKKIEKYIESDKKIRAGKLKRMINQAQKLSEERAVMSRQQALMYDQVMQRQRNLVYAIRNELLDGGTLTDESILEIARENISLFARENKKLDDRLLRRYILDNISYRFDDDLEQLEFTKKEILGFLLTKVEMSLNRQKELLGSKEAIDSFLRVAALSAIDEAWVEQVDFLQQLQAAVSGRNTAQRNPVFEYQREALDAFNKMERVIKRNIIRNILLSSVSIDSKLKLHIVLP